MKINEDGSYAEWPAPGTIVFDEPELDNVVTCAKKGESVNTAAVVLTGNRAVSLDPHVDKNRMVRTFVADSKIYATQEAAIRAGIESEKDYVKDLLATIKIAEDYLAGLQP